MFYDVGLLHYARRGHTRNDAHCRSHARNVFKTAINTDARKEKNDNATLTKNVEPPAQETRVVTNASKLLKENHKLRRIIAGWKGDFVQRGQIRSYTSMQLDRVYLADIM